MVRSVFLKVNWIALVKLLSIIGAICLTSSFSFSSEPGTSLDAGYYLSDDFQGMLLQNEGSTDFESKLVDIESLIPGVILELRYSTEDNFTGQVVYDFNKCLMLQDAALRLREVQEELKAIGLGIKIWDGYRPMAAQWRFWELIRDERYVSDPRMGGRHTRGTAVDLTLVTAEGRELRMPSEFDDFSEKAHRDYMEASLEEIENRDLLQNVMERHGFIGLPTEWWHFDLIGWEDYPPLDIDPNL